MAKERFAFLDILKVLSIFLVILFHFWYQITLNNSLRVIGFIGVSLFFIISGFSLAKNYPEHTKFSFKWFLKRYLKIASVYYIALILIVILFSKQSYSGNLFLNLLSHFTFTDSLFMQFNYGIISPAWFLAPLIVYYLLFPWLNRVIKNNWKIIIPIFIATAIMRIIYGGFVSTNALFFLAEFCFGIAIAYNKKISIIAVPIIIIFVKPIMYVPFVIFYAFSFIKNKHALSKIATWISGQIIFLFLFHEALIYLIFDKWHIYSLSKPLGIIAYLVAVVMAVYISNKIQKGLTNKLFKD